MVTGPSIIKDENASLTGWVYIDVADRDLGGYVEDAKRTVESQLKLPEGYTLVWTGQYEFMQRVKARLKIVVPITLAIIIVMIFMNFGSIGETIIVLLSLPFALTGSFWLMHILTWMHPENPFNLSIAVWVGIIALAGVAAETGIIMIVYLDEAFHMFQKMGRMRHQYDLLAAITYGAVQRIRPKLMTVMCILMGLIPLLWAHGAGADVMRRIAVPMIGGVITSSILTLEIVPAIYSIWRGRQVQKVKLRPRRSDESVIYSCPFHPEEKDSHHRQCSHCGMYLQEEVESRIVQS
jgi:Cu(I)/Ag(I) efflux system membrane protein CusA/SilA